MYVGNLQKLKVVKKRIKKYNMMDTFKILVMVDSDTENPACGGGMKRPKGTYLSIGHK